MIQRTSQTHDRAVLVRPRILRRDHPRRVECRDQVVRPHVRVERGNAIGLGLPVKRLWQFIQDKLKQYTSELPDSQDEAATK